MLIICHNLEFLAKESRITKRIKRRSILDQDLEFERVLGSLKNDAPRTETEGQAKAGSFDPQGEKNLKMP